MSTDVGEPRGRTILALELLVLAALAAAFLLLFQTRPGFVDLALAIAAVGLIAARSRASVELWRRAPVAPSGDARAAWWPVLLFTGLAATLFLAIGLYRGHAADGWAGAFGRVASWHLAVACLLYFPWALLQQFVFQFYLLGRLVALLPYPIAVLVTGAAFAAVHFPRIPVMVGTAIAGAVWALCYSRYRRLLPLAASHALLAATLHYWVFGRDLLEIWILR